MRGKSDATPWYGGPPLLEHLETVDARRKEETGGFRLPVQWVCRPNQNFRGFAGTVTGGAVAIGEEIAVLPSGQRSEEHTSELQSLMRISYAVFCLKKKK